MQVESTKRGDLFKFDYYKCLRSDYAKNECSICIELCPEKAMVFDRSRLTLDPDACTACAACVGSCPTEALVSETFDPNRFVLEFCSQEKKSISCKENLPCLGALSSEHFAAIVLRKGAEVQCDLAHCKECSINKEGQVFRAIESSIEEANRFLETCGAEKRVSTLYELPEKGADAGRRNLFRKLANVAREVNEDVTMSELERPEEEKEPLKRILLKNSIKMSIQKLEPSDSFEKPFSFAVGKKIEESTCTNCQECAMFCPTGALSILRDNTGIVFQVGKCIACSICNDVCKPGSISTEATFDIMDFAFDRMELLVKHTLEICTECKVAFPYRGGDKICDRCKDFKENFSDIFTMAKDM